MNRNHDKNTFCSRYIYYLHAGLITILILASCSKGQQQKNDLVNNDCTWYVDPMIGTSGHGHTFPGASLPFGMVQLSPDTYTKGWDWCSGYHYSDSSLMGFSHTHLTGTGRGDLLDILVMPTTGVLKVIPGSRENPDEGYRSRFKHKDEVTRPGYYSVKLRDYGIKAELTSTERAGFHRYTFPKSEQAHIIIDPFHGLATDSVLETKIRILNDSTIVGYRKSRGWGEPGEKYFTNQSVFFFARFSRPFKSSGIAVNNNIINGLVHADGKNTKAFVNYVTSKQEQILIKVGISSVDMDGAMKNVMTEIPSWNFDSVVSSAQKIWAKALSPVEIVEANEKVKRIFYTALYHSMLAPYTFSDVDGRYRGFDQKIHHTNGGTNYTVFSLWDTFRAEHPLFTLFQPDRVNDMVMSMMRQYREYGLLPVWPLWASETNCMIGYHSIPVITDAYFKGLLEIDIHELYKAMKVSAMQDSFGIKYLKKYNYIPFDLDNKSVSKTLEYAYDDWCMAKLAKALNYDDDYTYFMHRAESYKNLFDPQYQLMNGKDSHGNWRRPFDPFFSSYGPSDFIEGNSWQYSWFVPQDLDGLIKLFGGKENFLNKLNQLFTLKTSDDDGKPLDISGLIGEYAQGNEPSHHVAYLFGMAGKPEKTQYWLNKIMKDFYTDSPDGLCGNEDCGQMSAWYVFSALGFYPVNPASGNYNFGKPQIKKAVLHFGKKSFIIEAKNLSDSNIYVKSITLNGSKLERDYITHQEIVNGGKLVFNMSDIPKKQ